MDGQQALVHSLMRIHNPWNVVLLFDNSETGLLTSLFDQSFRPAFSTSLFDQPFWPVGAHARAKELHAHLEEQGVTPGLYL